MNAEKGNGRIDPDHVISIGIDAFPADRRRPV